MKCTFPSIGLMGVLGLLTGCQTEMALLEVSASAAMDAGSGSSSDGSGDASSITITTVTSVSGGGESGSDTGTTTGDDSDGSATTTGVGDAAPEILDVSVWPSKITANGPIAVDVYVDDAHGVRMLLENGSIVELSEEGAGHYSGEFPVITAAENGSHSVTLVAWRGDLESDEVEAPYVVALPEAGSELLWEADDSPFVGEGWIKAMGTLPTGHIIELGTRNTDDGSRCFMRRRAPGGTWGANDVVELLPGEKCEAVDLAIRDNGTIHPLLSRTVGPNTTWWLGDIPSWGANAIEMATGPLDEEAAALAYRAQTGALAVCGVAPSGAEGFEDLDAVVRIFALGEWTTRTFDHVLHNKKPHKLSETPQDCIFAADDRLVVVGDARGEHDEWEPPLTRRFVLPVQPSLPEDPFFTIGAKSFASQSFATAIDADEEGNLLVAGYACDDPCENKIEGRFWIYDSEGSEESEHTLGLFSYPEFAPHALAWSPAGYFVVANGGFIGDDASFIVRAFELKNPKTPLWTFTRTDPFVTHIPLVALVGPYAQLYFGGLGANIFPGILHLGS